MSYTLPEPHEYVWNPDGTFNIGQERCLSPNTGPCSGWEIYPIFTDDQMQSAFDAGRASRDAEVAALKAKVDKLDLELRVAERARDRRDESIEILTQTVDQLRLEAEGLERFRADAERYRWLRDQHWVEPEARFRLGLSNESEDDAALYEQELGKAIDAEMVSKESL